MLSLLRMAIPGTYGHVTMGFVMEQVASHLFWNEGITMKASWDICGQIVLGTVLWKI